MPHGGPDWGTSGKISTVHTIEDLGELAARLGSIVTFDRRGNVIWYDDFESGVHQWIPVLTAGRGSVEWDGNYSLKGGFSAKLTTGNVAGDKITVERWLTTPVLSRIGYELSFKLPVFLDFLHFLIDVYDGTYNHIIQFNWIKATMTWQYWGPDFAYHNLTPIMALSTANDIFHTVKVAADLTTGYYVRLIVNNTVYDLSGKQYRRVGAGFEPHLGLCYDITNDRAAKASSHLDDVIFTQNEP